jgi:hypothetical protein
MLFGVVLLLAVAHPAAAGDRRSHEAARSSMGAGLRVGAARVLTEPLPPPTLPLNIQVSSAYTTGGKLHDGALATDGALDTAWISDPAQPPQGQWIEWDMAPGVQLTGLQLTNDGSAAGYSRPLTTTLSAAGVTQVITWTDTVQDQIQLILTPVGGRVRLTIDGVWGDSSQPVGIAELVLATDAPIVLPTISGPNTTSPTTVPLAAAPPAAAPPAAAQSSSSGDLLGWVVISVLAVVAVVFVVRALRMRRG